MQTTPQIAGYCRVSTKAQADGDSLENQEHALRQAGAELIFSDVVSGFSKKTRGNAVGFQSLLAAIRTGEVSKLLVKDIARAARRDVFVHELLEACDGAGVEFLSLQSGRISTGTSAEWLNVRMLTTFNEYFSRDLSDRIRRGQASYVQRGIPAFSSVTLPWHLVRDPNDRHKAVPGPGWGDAREAVTRYIGGEWGAQQVAEFLYRRHQVMRTATSVLGWFRSHGIRGHYGKHRGPVLISNCYPALVDDVEAQALDRRIEKNRWGNGGKRKHVYALSGVCSCYHCGQRLVCFTTRNSAGKDYSYVRCNSPGCKAERSRIPHNRLEEWVWVRIENEAGVPLFDPLERHPIDSTPPGMELLNLRRRVATLRGLLEEVRSPGVEADLAQALERLKQLEAPREPRRVTGEGMKSAEWRREATATERGAELLGVVGRAEVDLTQWKALPPSPQAEDDLGVMGETEEWERECSLALIPELTLRA